MHRYLAVWLLMLLPAVVYAQQGLIKGTVLDQNRQPLEMATVGVQGRTLGIQTNAQGRYSLKVPVAEDLILVVRFLGYKQQERRVRLETGQELVLEFVLEADPQQLRQVDVRGKREDDTREQVSVTRLDPTLTKTLPSAFGDFNMILATLPGVTSNNELSSTYSVRGGNYDENLVYVNGIEIYRPFLISAAQQEGLSFVNPDLVANVEFSSGGWQPKYGDKLSSVLNIQYKRPTDFAGSVTGSLTGGAIHLEEASKNKRISYLMGLRHKNSRYMLQGLQVDGEYRPTFTDGQVYLSFDLGKDPERTTLGLLGSYARNNFRVEPQTRTTTFGTRQAPLRLLVEYDGQENMEYDTYQVGANLSHQVSEDLLTEFIISGVHSLEREFRDIEALYRLCDVNTLGRNDKGECLRDRGIGSQFDHARNALKALVLAAESRNTWRLSARSTVLAGAKASLERINDRLAEYGFVDSSDYVTMAYQLDSELNLHTQRYNGYVQHTYELDSLRTITYGIRASYWSYNNELTITPRIQYSFITRHNPDLSFKAAIGLYYQPPFYRELRNFQGELNPDLKAQRSLHAVVGSDYLFKAWDRDFKLTTEAYYKHMTNVIPYDLDNVRLRYYGQNNAKAYAAGFDVRVNGEFIKGAESWLSLGVMQTRENVQGDSSLVYNSSGEIVGSKDRGYLRRPTDQLVNIGVFFQDHLPDNPTVRMYLNAVYGSGLPFGPPNRPEFRNAFSGKSYKRVDIGFSKLIALGDDLTERKKVSLESLWIGMEVLNIIDAKNRISYSYVTDVNNLTYAIPNFLTGRRLNLRFIARF
ncbi:TonB-dependent receptor [Pontibacter virosus]|uniref:Outer membrane receptor protein involved in Fe transport n=1 Tax=Pontibacter virosus TaxID=1765052 RepID=A0A2U1AWE7_9BACT|nr:TonB-dependent receptor [Pontibacter virosus]PVY40765.1 outer membrane receptor protein involved in Fe transport [Pontibacter virosus]